MSPIQANTPKGTRDFNPGQVARRSYISSVIRDVFERYGFQPLETPAMENLETLLGKYGDEGDRLIFKILNSGDYLGKARNSKSEIRNASSKELTPLISEKALRYDLTVPFARYVVQNRNDITFPFKRYQIQPVWRADRPQKGRYREFYQCDADVIGSNALLNEAELVKIMNDVFSKLGVDASILINNRKILESKILQGVDRDENSEQLFSSVTVSLDKFDKIGGDGVTEEMKKKEIPGKIIENVNFLLRMSGSNEEKVNTLKKDLSGADSNGLEEIEKIFDYLKDSGAQNVVFEPTLARGLDYYTATIFEAKVQSEQSESVAGGGRYDDLTNVFGLKDISGVGFSFGLDRIYNVMEASDLFPKNIGTVTKVLFINFDEVSEKYVLPLLQQTRDSGINAEIFPDQVKLAKQMKYANSKNIPFVVLVGTEEMKNGKLSVKNMETGEQQALSIDELIETLKD